MFLQARCGLLFTIITDNQNDGQHTSSTISVLLPSVRFHHVMEIFIRIITIVASCIDKTWDLINSGKVWLEAFTGICNFFVKKVMALSVYF